MVQTNQPVPAGEKLANPIRVIRHNQVCKKMQISSAKLFDMVARGQFLKPFLVGFLSSSLGKGDSAP